MQWISHAKSFFLIAAVLLLTVGAGLRIFHLGSRSLWYDEAATARMLLGEHSPICSKRHGDSAHRLYIPTFCTWSREPGDGPVAVRAPSTFASFLAIIMMLAMIRVKVSRNAAIFAAAVLALSASQIRYAQEVREYSLAVLCASILIFALLKWETKIPDVLILFFCM